MRKLGVLRGLAIVAVVVGHAAFWGVFAGGYWAHSAGGQRTVADWGWVDSPTYYALMGVTQLSLFSVPVFLFCAALFVVYAARGDPANLTFPVVRGWLKGLIVPCLCWVAISLGLYPVTLAGPGAHSSLIDLLIRRIQNYHFVPLLAELFLLSPSLVWLAFRRPRLLLLATGALELAYAGLRYLVSAAVVDPAVAETCNLLGPLFVWRWWFFFALGLVVARRYDQIRRRLMPLRWPLAAAAVALGLLSLVEVVALHRLDNGYGDIADWKLSTFLYVLAVLLTLVAWDWRRSRLSLALERLGAQSYSIYLIQAIAVEFAAKLVSYAAPGLIGQQLAFQTILLAVGLGAPLLVLALAPRLPARRYHRLVFGSVG